jgi:poly-beta-1,6-N-acetyl-D-glucosamine biosynthesis protein PgaD
VRIRLRDQVLTLLAWAVYLEIMYKPVLGGIAWLGSGLGVRHLLQVVEVEWTIDVRPHLWIALVLVVWIVVIGASRKRHLQRQASPENRVPALSPEEQFASTGVPVSQVSLWQGARRLRVHHDEQGRISRVVSDPVRDPNRGLEASGAGV